MHPRCTKVNISFLKSLILIFIGCKSGRAKDPLASIGCLIEISQFFGGQALFLLKIDPKDTFHRIAFHR